MHQPETPITNDTRELVLDAAVRLLLTSSIRAISMAAIATEAGVSRRTVFNHFPSKETVFAAAMERVWARLPMAEITSSTEALAHPEATLTEIGRAIVSFWLPQRAIDIARMVIRESIHYPELSGTYIERGKRPTLDALIAYLSRLAADGRMEIADADLAARQFVGLINEPLVFYRVLGLQELPTRDRADLVVAEAVKMFIARYPLKT